MNWLQQRTAGPLMQVRPQTLASRLKSILGFEREAIQTPEGVFFADPVSLLGRQLWTRGIFEPETIAIIRGTLPTSGVFVDLGANEGYFTVIGSRTVGPAGRVLAVEPQSRMQEVIARNLALNHCGNVTIAARAIAKNEGLRTLYLTSDCAPGGSGLQRTTRYNLPSEEVRASTLQGVFEEYGITHCDLMKMDIEGAEHEAILGSPELFREHVVKRLALSLHPEHIKRLGHEPREITGFLAGCGYRTHVEYPGLWLMA